MKRNIQILLLLTSLLSCTDDRETLPDIIITGFTPTEAIEGAEVTISGENFGNSDTDLIVEFGGVKSTILSVSDKSIVATVPEGAISGPIEVSIGARSATSTETFIVIGMPLIASFSPVKGLPGTEVVISGNNFGETTEDIQVTIGESIASITASDETSITIEVPEGAYTGIITVKVDGLVGISSTEFIVPPTIETFEPGSALTGSEVTITGTGFSLSPADLVVTFNEEIATIKESSLTSIKVIIPESATTGKIAVSNSGEEVSTDTDFVVLPKIESFDPTFGPVGTVVTVEGSGFSNNTDDINLKLGDLELEVMTAEANQLTFTVPEGALSSEIEVQLGDNTDSSEDAFEVVVEAVAIGGDGYDVGYSIVVDSDGSYYVGGGFQNSITISAQTIQSIGNEDAFLAKFNSESELQWIKRAGSSSNDRILRMALDASGNLVFTMNTNSNADYDGTALTNSLAEVAIIKISQSGDIIWQNSGDRGTIHGLDIDNDGNVLIAGSFDGSLSFGTTDLNSVGESDSFIAKLNGSDGSEIWATSHGGTDATSLLEVATDGDGNVYASGNFFGTITIGTSPIESSGGLDGYVVKYDEDGNLAWSRHIASTGWNSAISIDADINGDFVVTGYYTGSAEIGGNSITSNGNEDMYIIKYTSSGEISWLKSVGDFNYENGRDVTIMNGNIYITGFYGSDVSFGNIELANSGNSEDVFVAVLNSNGDFTRAMRAGSGETDHGNSIFVDGDGIIHVTGFYRNFTTKFGITDLNNSGNDDSFVWKIWPE